MAANRKVDLAMATPLSDVFTEVLIAPDYDADALELLMKKPSIRILKCALPSVAPLELRPVSGGILLEWVEGGLQSEKSGRKSAKYAKNHGANASGRSARSKAANGRNASGHGKGPKRKRR